MRLQTQWRRNQAGRITGLDYSGVRDGLRMMRIFDDSGELFEQLQTLEFAALSEIWRRSDGN